MKKLLSIFGTLTICSSAFAVTACGYKDKKIATFQRKVEEMATILYPVIASESTNINLNTLNNLVENKKINDLNPNLKDMGYLKGNKSYREVLGTLINEKPDKSLDIFYEKLFNSFFNNYKEYDWKTHGLENMDIQSAINQVCQLLTIVSGAIKTNMFDPKTFAWLQSIIGNLQIDLATSPLINFLIKTVLDIFSGEFDNTVNRWIKNVEADIKKDNQEGKITNQSFADYIFVTVYNMIDYKYKEKDGEKLKNNFINQTNFKDVLKNIESFVAGDIENINIEENTLENIFGSLIVILANIPLNDDIKPIDGNHVFSNEQDNTKFLENFWNQEKDNDNFKIINKFKNNFETLISKSNEVIVSRIFNLFFSVNINDERINNIFKDPEIFDLDFIHYKDKRKPKPPKPKKTEYFLKDFKYNVGLSLLTNTVLRKVFVEIVKPIKLAGAEIWDLLTEQFVDIKVAEKIQILLSVIGKGVDLSSIKQVIVKKQKIDIIQLGGLIKLDIDAQLGYKDSEYFDNLFKNKNNELITSLFYGNFLNQIFDVDEKTLNDFKMTVNISGLAKDSINVGEPNLLKNELPKIRKKFFISFFQNQKQWNIKNALSLIFDMFNTDQTNNQNKIFNEFETVYLDLKRSKNSEIANKFKNIKKFLFENYYQVRKKSNLDDQQKNIVGYIEGLDNSDERKELSLLELIFESLGNKNLKIYDKENKLLCEGKEVTLFILGWTGDKTKFAENSIFENLEYILKSEELKNIVKWLDVCLENYKNNYKKLQDKYLKYINYQNYKIEIKKDTIKDYQFSNGDLVFTIQYTNLDNQQVTKFLIGIGEIDKTEPKTIVRQFKKIN